MRKDLKRSSPRVWGQERYALILPCIFRIIPTRMGTSVAECLFEIIYRDHPHAYGDKSLAPVGGLSGNGSSPRVWGQVVNERDIGTGKGIIPMRMGTSLNQHKQLVVFINHPHAYGDKPEKSISASTFLGSSPRVWGQDELDNLQVPNLRIIPTRMGTRSSGGNK